VDESGESDFQGAQIKTVMHILAHFTIWRDFHPKIETSLEFYTGKKV
jgi:hypothetical protein